MAEVPDFQKHEEQLFEFTIAELKKFATQNQEQFSYFAFDCNPDYGEVLLCLDTTTSSTADAWRTAQRLLDARRKQFAKPYAEIPPHDLQWSVYYLGIYLDSWVLPYGNNAGDFSHQGFAQLEFDDWMDFSMEDSTEFVDSKESRIACFAAVLLTRVIDRLVDSDAFAPLNRSHPFYCGVSLHDGPQRVVRMLE